MRGLEDEPYLVVVIGSMAKRLHAIGAGLVIGRDPTSDLFIPSPAASRRHAVIERTKDDRLIIEDQGSQNGTRVNGKPISRQELRFGDSIQIAQTLMVVVARSLLMHQLLDPQSLESLGKLAGGVGHRFNNLMAVVHTNVSFLQSTACEGPVDPEVLLEVLSDIETAARRATDLTSQLLGFDELRQHEPEAVNLSALVVEVGALLTTNFAPSVKLDVKAEPNLTVLGDRSKLHKMLMNLCLNAYEAMPEGGTLTLGLRRDAGDRGLLVTVADTGLGMEEAVRARAFEPLFTTKASGASIGLGLTAVYGIARAHGGSVRVESAPGKGSRFVVSLPEGTSDAAALLDTEEPTQPVVPSEARRILLVDDEPAVASSVLRLLEQAGYEVLVAGNGQEALDLFSAQEGQIDVVLLDIVMPVMDGLEALRRLRSLDPEVRVIITSGYSERSLRERDLIGAEQGVLFLPKPYDSATLFEALRRV